MATEECAICGDSVPFATTTHVLVNPKHEEGVADHYVCRPCYDEHLEGLFAALSDDEREGGLAVDVADEETMESGEESGAPDDDATEPTADEEPVDTSPD